MKKSETAVQPRETRRTGGQKEAASASKSFLIPCRHHQAWPKRNQGIIGWHYNSHADSQSRRWGVPYVIRNDSDHDDHQLGGLSAKIEIFSHAEIDPIT